MSERIQYTAPTKAIIWTRVSTKEQDDEGVSLEMQMDKAQEFCKSKGLTIIESLKVVESASTRKRPQFDQLIELLSKQKETVALVCYATDRLSRRMESAAKIADLATDNKIVGHFIREHLVLDARSDNFSYMINSVLACRETQVLAIRVIHTFDKKRSKATICGPAPVGYINVPRNKKIDPDPILEIDKVKGSAVTKLFEEYSTGLYSMYKMVERSFKRGLTTTRGNKKPIVSMIERILSNPFYYGIMRSERYDMQMVHNYPTLTTKKIFDKCQEVRQGKRSAKTKVVTKTEFLYSGLIKCHHCGCTYSPEVKTKRVKRKDGDGDNKFQTVVVSNSDNKSDVINTELVNSIDKSDDNLYYTKEYIYLRPSKGKGKCKHCYHINSNIVDHQIDVIMNSIYIPKELVEQMKSFVQSQLKQNSEYRVSQLDDMDKAIKDNKSKLDDLDDKFTEDKISSDNYERLSLKLKQKSIELEEERKSLLQNNSDVREIMIDAFRIASNVGSLYKSSRIDKKRQILNLLFSNLELSGKNLRIYLQKPFNLMLPEEVCTVWLPALDKFRTKSQVIMETMGRVLPFEQERICA